MKNIKPRIAISFSGGRTSAVMTKLCVEQYKDTHDIVVIFANTGSEHINTLKFVDQCDKAFNWNVVWVEALVDPRNRKGIRHKVVDYETASRDHKPLRDIFSKHGLSGPGYPHCTRDSKEYPINSYLMRDLGWERGSYWTCIGIRADEIDRVNSNKDKYKLLYPLVDAGWNKSDVLNECNSWAFDLDLKGEHYGNCVWCWKKSTRKLMTLAQDDESIFDFAKEMEEEYSEKVINPEHKEHKRYFFRERMTVADIIKLSKELEFTPYSDKLDQQMQFNFMSPSYDMTLDTGESCGESCEIMSDIS
jgi:hypothetical protein